MDTAAWPDLMTADEVIRYLRLDEGTDDLGAVGRGGPRERLRALIRRQQLPHIKRGRLLRFRKSAIDDWLAAGERGRKTRPAATIVPSTKAV